MSHNIIVDLYISADEYLKIYQGSAKFIKATAIDGRSVRFPANIMQKFVLHDGLRGRFEIEFDREHKFKQVKRLA